MHTIDIHSSAELNTYLQSDHPVLIDFWAPWCGPCKALAPALNAVATELHDRVKTLKIDIQAQPELGQAYGVKSIPSLVLLKGDEVIDRSVGVQNARSLLHWVEEGLQS